MENVIKDRPVNNVTGAIVFGKHLSCVNITGRQVSIILFHDIWEALPPCFKIIAVCIYKRPLGLTIVYNI